MNNSGIYEEIESKIKIMEDAFILSDKYKRSSNAVGKWVIILCLIILVSIFLSFWLDSSNLMYFAWSVIFCQFVALFISIYYGYWAVRVLSQRNL